MGSSPQKYIEYADMPYMLRLLRHIDKETSERFLRRVPFQQ